VTSAAGRHRNASWLPVLPAGPHVARSQRRLQQAPRRQRVCHVSTVRVPRRHHCEAAAGDATHGRVVPHGADVRTVVDRDAGSSRGGAQPPVPRAVCLPRERPRPHDVGTAAPVPAPGGVLSHAGPAGGAGHAGWPAAGPAVVDALPAGCVGRGGCATARAWFDARGRRLAVRTGCHGHRLGERYAGPGKGACAGAGCGLRLLLSCTFA